jgi:hypothetical protein
MKWLPIACLAHCIFTMKWFENQPAWDKLLAHCKSCSDDSCSCKAFVSNFEAWSKRLPIDPDQDDDPEKTWLWFALHDGHFRWQCIACHRKGTCCDSTDGTGFVQIQNLLKHHTSSKHVQVVNDAFGVSTNVAYVTPSRSLFKELLVAFQQGIAPENGYTLKSGILGCQKAKAMLWCLAQARDDDKRDALRLAEVMVIMRDERKKRMHIRFNCACPEEVSLHDKCGFLGQRRDHQPDAYGVTQGTLAVFKDICTSRSHAPQPLEAEPCFDKRLFARAAHILEATVVDSASNEITSITDSSAVGPGGEDPTFPNNKHVLRDAAHSARRLLARLYYASAILKETWEYFMALAMIIQWSPELRQLFAECVEEADDSAVDTKFKHLRAAKHRIETWLTPLSRSLTCPSGSMCKLFG